METISVIIPTTCELRRKESLTRAVESILGQQGVKVELIVVVNGTRFDAQQLQLLRADPRLKVSYIEIPGLPTACKHGRSLVSSTFFCFLDDDDEYLPNALVTRTDFINADSTLDAITTNGIVNDEKTPAYTEVSDINADPIAALAKRNWLASCGGLYRASSVSEQHFVDLPKYSEWTTLAFRLLLSGKRVRFCDVPTFRINDTAESLSKSDAYRLSSVSLVEAILRLPLPKRARQPLRVRLLAARHDLSVHYLSKGDKRHAWKLHLLSLCGLSGLRYLSYTRHLLT